MLSLLPLDGILMGRAAAVITSGGVVAFPTDTVYGLGCDPKNPSAVERLFRIKGREKKPIPVLCSSQSRAAELVRFSSVARILAARHWPGRLTLVLPLRVTIPEALHAGTGWLGVRVPRHDGCLELIKRSGGYITGTSANRSGLPACRSAKEVLKQLGGRVDIVLDGGLLAGLESTVARVNGRHVEVLRRGPISIESGGKGWPPSSVSS